MAKEVWALDLGDWSLKVARGHYDSGSEQIVLNLYEELRFSSLGLQEDAAQMEKYRVGLEEFEKRFDVGASDELCVAVSGSEVFSRFINLPPVPESISEIITYEARQQIPFDIDDVVWDYQPLKEEHQPGEEIEVGLFALKRDSIDELMELLEPWKHNLRVIQDGPLAVYNMLVFEGHTDGASIVIDMGARSTDVLVLNHPRFWMRPLLIGANGITERLKSHFGVSWQEAERIKERASERDREAQLLRIVQPVVENIVSEIQRSLGYYKSLSKGVQIQKIWAVGNAFKLKGLDRVLGDNLQYDVEKPEVLQNFDIASSVDGKRLRSYIGGACTALGLLVQGTGQAHIDINLIPEELASAHALREKKPWLMGAAATILLGVGVMWGGELAYGRELADNLDTGKDVSRRVEEWARQYRQAESEAQQVAEEVKSLTEREVNRDILLQVLPSIVQSLPEDRVFVRDMEFAWMEESDFETAVEEETLDLEGEEGEGADTGRRREDAGRRREPERDRSDGQRYRRPSGMERDKGAQFSGDSVLTVQLSCESTAVSRALEYVKSEVVEPLSAASSAKDGSSVLAEVHLVGRPENVYRSSQDGTLVDSPDDEDVIQFVSFDILARVNLGDESDD
ncbi:MAG: pilus assembly protein PilM [Planctomycetota bacterium]